MFLRLTRDPEIENSENGTPVLPSHPLTRGPTSGGGRGRKERARERMYCAYLHCMHPPRKRVIWHLQEHAKHLFTQIAANETTCTCSCARTRDLTARYDHVVPKRRSQRIMHTVETHNRFRHSQNKTQRAFAHEKEGVEPEMRHH